MAEFGLAQKGLPNASEVYLAIGAIQRRQGKWEESNANIEKAASLSPNETWPLQNLALNYQMQRNFDAANKTIDRALKLAPESFPLWTIKAQIEISEKGTYEVTERGAVMVAAKPMSEEGKLHFNIGLVQIRLLQRRYADVVELTKGMKDELFHDDFEGLMGKYGAMGIAKKMLGDEAGAREALLKFKAFAEKYVAAAPNDAKRHSRLGESLAWLGEKDAAIAEAKRATELLPESVDAFDGPVCTQTLAEIYAIVGEHDKALELLDGLLSRPTQVTVAQLKVHPLWDKIREDPRFVAMLKRHGG
jgi:tetratricopeptide (TPR) repeat protein